MIRKKKNDRSIVIDLTGPKGNAYYLLGLAKDLSAQLDLDYQSIRNEMESSDYENLVQVFDKNFGCVVTLER